MAKPDGQDGESPVNATLRRDRMLAVIREREFVRVTELSERFDVSEVTVRERSRCAGGPRRGPSRARRRDAAHAPGQERPFEETETSHAAEKVAIGQAAARLVREAETLLLDVGTTAAAAGRGLARATDLRNVVVFTSGLKTALELEAGDAARAWW